MNSFIWRGLTCRLSDKYGTLIVGEDSFEFPGLIRRAIAFDQNRILVSLEDGTLWQCGGVPKGPLVLAAAANKIVLGWVLSTLSRRREEAYAALVDAVQREFDKTFKPEPSNG